MTPMEIRSALVALIARIDGNAPAPAAPRPPAAQAGTCVQQSTVAEWKVARSKTKGTPYAVLRTTDGGRFPVFARELLALDPILPGTVIELTTQQGKNEDGTTFEKVVGIRILSRPSGAAVAADDDIPF
jgi:hypothetical protein